MITLLAVLCCFFGVGMVAAIMFAASIDTKLDTAKEKIKELNTMLANTYRAYKNACVERDYYKHYYKQLLDGNAGSQTPAGSLTKEELKALLSLCHPDKHGNSRLSTRMTQRLLELR